MRITSLRALALIAALLSPTLAVAQSQPDDQDYSGPGMMWGSPGNGYWMGSGMMGPGMMGSGMMRGCPMMGAMMRGGGGFQRSAAAWLDGQLAFAHTEIGITSAQEPAWKAYADAVHARSDQMISTHQSMMGAMWQGGLAFNEAYDLHIKVMEAHLDAMKASRDTALKLYSTLTPEQQKKASWVLPRSMCMM